MESDRFPRLWLDDIETVPDTRRMNAAMAERVLTDPAFFPPTPFHRVVCISQIEAHVRQSTDGRGEKYEVVNLFSGGRKELATPEETEGALVRGFWGRFNRVRPRIVTWNGRKFDLMVLRARAMLYGVQIPAWTPDGPPANGYGYRYSRNRNVDLADAMSGYGATNMVGQDDMCRVLGLPGKFNGHGSEVAAMIAEGRRDDACNYCDGDVLNLFVLLCRFQFLEARMTARGYNESIESLLHYLHRNPAPHTDEFANRLVESPMLKVAEPDEAADTVSPSPDGIAADDDHCPAPPWDAEPGYTPLGS